MTAEGIYHDALVAVLNSRKHSAAVEIAMNALGQAARAGSHSGPAHRTGQGEPNHPALRPVPPLERKDS